VGAEDEVTREWRKIHNVELNGLYSSPNIIRMIKSGSLRWVGHLVCVGARSGTYRVLVRKPVGKRPLRRPRRRWKDNINVDLQEVECVGMNGSDLAQNRDKWRALVNSVMNLWVS
jgi:hypothetical protein